jgi:hypothetical protein
MIPYYLIQQIPPEQRLQFDIIFIHATFANEVEFKKPYFPIVQISSSRNTVVSALLFYFILLKNILLNHRFYRTVPECDLSFASSPYGTVHF